MLCNFKNTWNDASLYGHRLTSLPAKCWNFTKSKILYSYTVPDEGTAEKVFFIFEKYQKTIPVDGGIRFIFGTNILLFSYSELVLRKVGGTVLTGASMVLSPLGFAVKLIHKNFK